MTIATTEIVKTITEKLTELHEATPRAKQRRIHHDSHDWANDIAWLLRHSKDSDIRAYYRARYSVPNSYKNKADTDCVEVDIDLLALTFTVKVERRQAVRKSHGGSLYATYRLTDAATGCDRFV